MRFADSFESRRRADADPAFRFEFDLRRDETEGCIHLSGRLRRHTDRGEQTLRIDDLVRREGDRFHTRDGQVVRVEGRGVPPLLESLCRDGSIKVPFARENHLRAILGRIPWHTTATGTAGDDPPTGHVYIDVEPGTGAPEQTPDELGCRLSFLYGEVQVHAGAGRQPFLRDPTRTTIQLEGGGSIKRIPSVERALLQEFLAAGGRVSPQEHDHEQGRVSRDDFPGLVTTLVARDWVVEANGRRILAAEDFHGSIESRIDWLELRGGMRFGDTNVVGLPELLRAAQVGSAVIRLPDGSFGILPEEWLRRLDALSRLGETAKGDDGGICQRFRPNQGLVLDALLAAEQGARLEVDAAFAELRERVRSFQGFRRQPTPEGFQGKLRPYQQDALGWVQGLAQLGLGGCLADDMGLGKTVQVLAVLHAHYRPHERRATQLGRDHRPSLIVAPSSLVFNWQREAARFSPDLRTLAWVGGARSKDTRRLRRFDVLFTTYGTLRQDVELLQGIGFDYVVLDEAQAIKSSSSLTAKAARLLHAEHRLALSGTPIENHLGELWSLFEFLNPGMLGRSHDFRDLVRKKDKDDETEQCEMLGAAIRPFFLRRTKQQVLTDLPAKTEQVIHCELGTLQRREYDTLLTHYQHTLLADRGSDPGQMHVLEALLRLRQASSHLGLLDSTRAEQRGASAKLDVLLPMLEELAATGHKALVFSQFTTLLGFTRDALRARGIEPLYLDGSTRDRQAQVDAFQNDPGNRVFLISIKAGGAGLNLTAADYVFLLDPWWNPAVEAQAIDRSHRMGQRRKVTAYRLIAAGTIEEKVRRLQEQKRELADTVFGADNAELRRLTRENLQALLS